MSNGWGGKRPGAGRKKNLSRIVREMAIDEANADAKYALGLHAAIMRDEAKDIRLRLESCVRIVRRGRR